MKVHSTLKKRPIVLLQILLCMGVLSTSDNQVNAITLRSLAHAGVDSSLMQRIFEEGAEENLDQ